MMFSFLVAMLGFSIAIRYFNDLVQQNFFSKREMTKIGTAHLAIILTLLLLLPRSHRGTWIATCAPLILTAGAAFAVVRWRSTSFRAHVRDALSIIALKMKSGRSFRQALAETCNESDARFRSKFSEISNAVVFSQQQKTDRATPFIAEVIEEFVRIDQNPHASTKRLAVFRNKLRIEDDFRRRSGQVLSRIRAQSLVMSVLYALVFVFMIWKFGWDTNAPVLLTSALLFFVGVAWITLGGRRLKWKV